ncbi:MAG: hypothetical protein K5696_08535 [Lachnospiraceae bacterium]|nr:hypothetical protein [Lachnospiraceae bacterium]
MMTFVQLGWIQDAINYVFDKVLNPIFSFVSNLLSDVFKWLFNTILGPLLETAFSLIMQTVGKYIMRIYGRFMYAIEKGFLLILEMMQSMFDVLAGKTEVTDTTTGAHGSLLSVLVRTPFVTKTMGIVIMISFVLCFLFAIVATVRSIGEMGGQNSQPVGQVLRNLARAMLRMVAAPLLGLFMIVLGDAVLVAVTNAMTLSENVTIAQTLFVISSLDAVDDELGAVDKDGVKHKGGQRLEFSFKNQYASASSRIGDWDNMLLGYNYSTRSAYLEKHPGEASDYGLTDRFREPFYTGKKDYASSVDVDATFNVGRLDYLVGIGGAILFIFVLGTALFLFVSRLFDVIVLLIIEPFFIAPMPLDDGEHFKKWEEMFLGRLFSGYGMVVAMYIYLLICSMVFSGKIAFTSRGDMGDILTDMLMRMLLLIGGAATIVSAGPLVTSILSSAAAGIEGESSAAGMAFTGKMMDIAATPAKFGMKKGIDKVTDGIIQSFSGGPGKGGSAITPDGKTDGGAGDSNLFSGKKSDTPNTTSQGTTQNSNSSVSSVTPGEIGPSDLTGDTPLPDSTRQSTGGTFTGSQQAPPMSTGGGINDGDDDAEDLLMEEPNLDDLSLAPGAGNAGKGAGGSTRSSILTSGGRNSSKLDMKDLLDGDDLLKDDHATGSGQQDGGNKPFDQSRK